MVVYGLVAAKIEHLLIDVAPAPRGRVPVYGY